MHMCAHQHMHIYEYMYIIRYVKLNTNVSEWWWSHAYYLCWNHRSSQWFTTIFESYSQTTNCLYQSVFLYSASGQENMTVLSKNNINLVTKQMFSCVRVKPLYVNRSIKKFKILLDLRFFFVPYYFYFFLIIWF